MPDIFRIFDSIIAANEKLLKIRNVRINVEMHGITIKIKKEYGLFTVIIHTMTTNVLFSVAFDSKLQCVRTFPEI